MRYGSVCSGVEAATLAWEHLGWQAVFYAEVEPFPAAVLQHRFGATRPLRPLDPAEADNEKDRKTRISWMKQNNELSPRGRIPNFGDFTKINPEDYDGDIDVLVGGFPCQAFSCAGARRGLADPRGNLALEFIKLAYRTKARIAIGENVPGFLSIDHGETFALFLSYLCGWEVPVPSGGWKKSGIVAQRPGHYGVAWRILDTQYTRVPEFPRAIPQRRRRLFIVGHLDCWEYSAAVLFDGEMRGGHSPPRRTKGQRVAAGTENGVAPAKWWNGEDHADTLTCTGNNQFMPDKSRLQCVIDMRQIEVHSEEVSPTLIATDYKGGKAVSFYPQRKAEGMIPLEECANTLVNGTSPGHHSAVCFENHGQDSRIKEVEVSPVLSAKLGTGGGNAPLVHEVFSFDSLDSNSMKSANPNSGCRAVDVAKTLDTTNPEPSKNQGGMAVVERPVLAFIKNDAGGDQDGYWEEVFPTLRTAITPAVARQECFNVTFCDANGTRKDRPDGGLYVTEAVSCKTITTGGGNAETIIIDPLETPIALDGDKMAKAERKGGSGIGVSEEGVMYTQTVKDVHGVAYSECVPLDLRNATRDPAKFDEMNRQGVGVGNDGDPMTTISASIVPGVGYQATVRRLLPIECEILMGFPANHTQIPWRGKPTEECPDAPRYKACGNAFTVNCILWLGYRIQMVENWIKTFREAAK